MEIIEKKTIQLSHEKAGVLGGGLENDETYRIVQGKVGDFMQYPPDGFSITGFISPEHAERLVTIWNLCDGMSLDEIRQKLTSEQNAFDDFTWLLKNVSTIKDMLRTKERPL